MSILSALGHMAFSYGMSTARPLDAVGQSEVRYQLGWTDVARERNVLYKNQRRSIEKEDVLGHIVSNNFAPLRFNPAQIIQEYNQLPWHLNVDNGVFGLQAMNSLIYKMADHGIRLEKLNVEDFTTASEQHVAGLYNSIAESWRRLIDFSSAAPSVERVIHDYYRKIVDPNANEEVVTNELNYNLQRAQYRRDADRNQLMKPYFRWSAADVLRLSQASTASEEEIASLMKAAGFANQRDREFLGVLADPLDVGQIIAMFLRGTINEAQTRIRLAAAGVINREKQDAVLKFCYAPPDAAFLLQAGARGLWNADNVAKYGLDEGSDNPIVKYWFKALGQTGPDGSPLPGANSNPSDWLKMHWRGARPLVDIGMSREMLHRLRPIAEGDEDSVVPGAKAWTHDNMRDMLSMSGWTEPFINRFLGMAYEPINIRLINHILGPYSTHPEVQRAAEQAFGVGVDWVENAMLDHGFSPAYAKVASVGVHAQADDRDNAEMKEHEKSTEALKRRVMLERYRVGTVGFEEAVKEMTGKQFPARIAADQLTVVAAEYNLSIVETQIKALHESYMKGKLPIQEISAVMVDLGITNDRVAIYLKEWTWERTENQQMLSTGEILTTMRNGLMSADVALQRLINLGWNRADALVEIALVGLDLERAQAKVTAATANKLIADQRKAEVEHERQVKTEAAEAIKAAKELHKVQRETALASHEKLLAQSEYYARVHASNSAFAAATKKGDTEKQLAELVKQIADYEKYLLAQLNLLYKSPEVANVVNPLDSRQAPGPQSATSASGPNTPTKAPADSASGPTDQPPTDVGPASNA